MLYCSYDHLVCLITGLFCIYAPLGLYSSLSPSLNKRPFGEQKVCLQCLHKGLAVKKLFLAGLSIFTTVFWMVFRNEEQWAWILPDARKLHLPLRAQRSSHSQYGTAACFCWHYQSMMSSLYLLLLH